MPAIQNLNISNCSNLVRPFSKYQHCPLLRTLNISNSNITEESIEDIISCLLPYLRELNASSCPNIEEPLTIKDKHEHLRSINLKGSRVSQITKQTLSNKCPKLRNIIISD